MTSLIKLYQDLVRPLNHLSEVAVLGLMARFVFAAVLFWFFWNSGQTKLGGGFLGLFQPSIGAYAQVFPRAMEAVTYDVSALAWWRTPVVIAGTAAEFILPLLIVVGLFTRLSALGMIGFVFVMSYVDITGHGVSGTTLGAWFDNLAGSQIWDQRTLWVFLLLVLVFRGPGLLSLDWLIGLERERR